MSRELITLPDGWASLERGIHQLQSYLEGEASASFSTHEYMDLYTTVYDMCTQKHPHDHSEQLYERYEQAFSTYVRGPVVNALRAKSGVPMLTELVARWNNHKTMVRLMSRIFVYLDRYYVARHQAQPLREVGMACFRDEVYEEVKENARDAILALMQQEREGELVDRKLLREALEIFAQIGMGDMTNYEKDFEEHMLRDTAVFYKRKASEWLMMDSCPEYMKKAEACLALETNKVREEKLDGQVKAEKGEASQGEASQGEGYLHQSTKMRLLQEIVSEVLAEYETVLLEKENSGCTALLRDGKTEDLSRMYSLFSLVEKGKDPIAKIFKQHIEGEGMVLVKEAEQAAERKDPKKDATSQETAFIRKAIKLQDKYLEYVNGCFGGKKDSLFHKALKEAFEVFCNKNIMGSTSAELMATFCDNLLKKGSNERLSDEQIEDMLDKVVRLLAFVSDKDLFGEFYRKKLSRRLLYVRSASEDHERSILARLKQQCGAQFTSKMEGMVNDLQLSKEGQSKFQEWVESNSRPPVDVSVTVLTTGYWPTYKTTELNLPAEMLKSVEVFKEHYEAETKHRKLTWVYTLGNCIIRGHFNKKKIEMILPTMQAACLLLFGGGEQISFKDVCQRLNVPEEDAKRALHGLSCARYKILLKEPDSKKISSSDKFSLNENFTDRMHRIKVPMPTVDEKKKVIEDVDKDRRYAIDAALVRVMKARKSLKHQELVLEAVHQLSRMFKPDFKMIKKRIEDLIQREYIERDKDSPNIYNYMA